MSETKISYGSNLLWEGSRFILPEHKKALLNYEQEQKRKERPLFDEQQSEYLDYRINEAIHSKKRVRLVVYGEYEDRALEGEIKPLDQHNRYLTIKLDHGQEYIELKDILSIGEGF